MIKGKKIEVEVVVIERKIGEEEAGVEVEAEVEVEVEVEIKEEGKMTNSKKIKGISLIIVIKEGQLI